jgi:glucose/arabinose dehydrogenase
VALATIGRLDGAVPLEKIRLPPGFSIALYAEVKGARSMVLGPKGTLFVGTRETPGKVFAVVTRGGKREVVTIASGLTMPNGVAFRDGSLYVAEVSRILRFDDVEAKLGAAKPAVVNDTFPHDTHHGWKYLALGPDGLLYTQIGAPCNVCKRDDRRYASIVRLKPDGTGFEVFAEGIRNSVGFDWNPATKELWFTENGRDWMGDDAPPDELNRAPKAGLHFGFPYCHGGDLLDPDFAAGHTCAEFVAPERKLGAHVAALGMKFYTGAMFPAEYKDQIFIAEHGSWNRSKKVGYRVTHVRLDAGHAASYEPFAEGWLENEKALGRPVDILVMPDGSMLVSDDEAGAIYRITYAAPAR